jgi:2-enoate reductase
MRIGSVTVKNRFSLAAMTIMGITDEYGCYNQRAVNYYGGIARGGMGLIVTGGIKVDNTIEQFPLPSFATCDVAHERWLVGSRNVTERVHAFDTKIFAQLTAGFGRGVPPSFFLNQAISASENPNLHDPSFQHRGLSTAEIREIVHKFGVAAQLAQRAGYDGVEVHAIHEGFLLDQFAVAHWNRRNDQYGGSLENRLRFAIEALQEIKKTCGQDYPVTMRFSVATRMRGHAQGILPQQDPALEIGRTLEEGLEVGKMLEVAGYDALNIDAGNTDAHYWNHPPNYFEPGMYRPFGKALKEVVKKIPVLMAGRMDNPDIAAKAIEDSETDGIALGRPILADPDIVNKIRRGRRDEIRPCLSCHTGCLTHPSIGGETTCTVNPTIAREAEMALTPALRKKKVVVVGGGPAGMEAARIASMRGHDVVLFEKRDKLGGNLIPASVPWFKQDDVTLRNWYLGEMERTKVDVRLNTEVTKAVIKAEEPDSVVFAVGAKTKVPDWLPGADRPNVHLVEEALMQPETLQGDTITVIGAGLVGCETALWLADEKGKKVILVERGAHGGGSQPMIYINLQMMRELADFHGIERRTHTQIKAITDQGILVHPSDNESATSEIPCDSVILALGFVSNEAPIDTIARELDIEDAFNIGDSRSVGNYLIAIREGYEIGRAL